jgi:hypothetical protein
MPAMVHLWHKLRGSEPGKDPIGPITIQNLGGWMNIGDVISGTGSGQADKVKPAA